MRRPFFIAFATTVATLLLAIAAFPALTQQPGIQVQWGQGQGQGQGRGQGGFGAMKGDPNMLFDIMAQGGDTINVNNAGMLKGMLTQFAASQGLTSDTINRQQFQQMMEKAMNPDEGTQKLLGNIRQQFADQQERIKQNPNGEEAKQWADTMANMKKGWEAYKAKMEQAEPIVDPVPALDLEELNKRPDVYRFGKMPKNLPAWFTDLDKDRDGQVGLYEWRTSDKSVQEFQMMDRNGDGLLTAEEVLFYMNNLSNALAKNGKGTVQDLTSSGYQTGPATQMPGQGWGKGGQGFNKGGQGMNNYGQGMGGQGMTFGQGMNKGGAGINIQGPGMNNGGQGMKGGRGAWGKGG